MCESSLIEPRSWVGARSELGSRLPCLRGLGPGGSEAAFPAFVASARAGSEAAFPAFVGTAPKDHRGPSVLWQGSGTYERRSRHPCLHCCGRSRERSRLPRLPCRSTEGISFTCTALTAQLCHEERSAFVPFGGLSNLDGDSASLAFTAREVLSLSGILLSSVRNASIGRAGREGAIL